MERSDDGAGNDPVQPERRASLENEEESPAPAARDEAMEDERHATDKPPRPRSALGMRWALWQGRYTFTAAVLASLAATVAWNVLGRDTQEGPTQLRPPADVSPEALDQDPVSVLVDRGHQPAYVVDRPPEEIPSAPPADNCVTDPRRRWLDGLDAIPANEMTLRITVSTTGSATVLVDGLEIKDLDRVRPVEGTNLIPCEGGGPFGYRYLEVDLDATPPRVAYKRENGRRSREFFFTVTDRKPEGFLLHVTASEYAYSWTADLLLQVNGERVRFPLQEGDKPFVITPAAPGHDYGVDRKGRLVTSSGPVSL